MPQVESVGSAAFEPEQELPELNLNKDVPTAKQTEQKLSTENVEPEKEQLPVCIFE